MSDFTSNVETAILHLRVGRLQEAEGLLREVLAGDPNHARAIFHLGVLTLQSGRAEDAAALFAQATGLAPDNAACHANLGEAQRRSGRSSEAIGSLLRAMHLNPRMAQPVYSLGLILSERGANEGALGCFQRAAELDPEWADARARIASAQTAVRSRDRSAVGRRHSTEEDVLSATTLMALARPLAIEGRLAQATALLEQVVDLHPRLVAAHCNLGVVRAALGQIDEAVASYRRALDIEPGNAEACHNLGNALLRGGLLGEAISTFRKAVALRPDSAAYHSDLVFYLHFHSAYDSRAILAEARAWDRAHAEPLAGQRVGPAEMRSSGAVSDRLPERRLRIGYVSPNFRRHCQAFFLFPLLAHHDHERFEIFCYSDVATPDDWTADLLRHADEARTIVGMSDGAVADRVRDDRIDILVDLTMHMEGSRLLVFARKPAPLQVCWLAYPGTTGLAAMDYRVTDPYLDPPDGSDGYSERLLRLPDTFWCYDPMGGDEGEVSPLPAVTQGRLQFGCLNNFLKVNEGTVALWARVMREADALNAKQGLRSSKFTLMASAGDARKRALAAFEGQGIEPGRVEFVDYQTRQAYLATYRSIDVCLDTLPYNGHTTSLDAFWMGVPVVTLVGSTVVGRAGLCQATNLGLPELVAHTADEYVRIAADLCGDLGRLSKLRAGLRARMRASRLMDAPRFASNLETAYRTIWRRRCSESP